MKKIYIMIILLVISLFGFTGCANKYKAQRWISNHDDEFHINYPEEYTCLFYISATSIDSDDVYMVLKIKDEDYKLEYDNQFFTDYAKYKTVDVFKKIELAHFYFQNRIKEEDEKYFVSELDNYDWYAYEYKKVSEGRVTVIRYIDLYIVHDKNENIMYIFYDKHQYPYNEQWSGES